MKKTILANIPTNIITGFLGAGKTTVIRHLLQTKPANEKWAVLVNEFGEVGIDGAILAAEGIAVKEVPGGCMCCAVGLPSKVALNQLIREHRPDRILIEPTGLAHPQQILQQFTSAEYASLLRMQSMVCLIDPWSVTQSQFTQLPAFQSQVDLADVVVMSKGEAASATERQAFDDFCQHFSADKTHIGVIEEGRLPWQWLTEDHRAGVHVLVPDVAPVGHRLQPQVELVSPAQAEPPATTLERKENRADFGVSCGWRIPASWVFNEDQLMLMIQSLSLPRVKGVMHCENGWYLFNRMRSTVSVEALSSDAPLESRIEMITTEQENWDDVEEKLNQCRML